MRYLELDVFPGARGGGNRLGVVIGAEEWDVATMQQFARMNDSVENAFVLTPTNPHVSYRVRIFTPDREIMFAGHSSIGSAHAALTCGLAKPVAGVLWQECGVGLLPVRVEGDGNHRTLLLKMPSTRVLRSGIDAHPTLCVAMAGIGSGKLPPVLVDGGRRWWLAEASDEASLRSWRPDHDAVGKLARMTDSMGLCVFARSSDANYQLVVRAFAPAVGITEDPASGAANGLLAAYIAHAEPAGPLAHGYVISQGREIARESALVTRVVDDGVWVGGHTRTVSDALLDWRTAPVLTPVATAW